MDEIEEEAGAAAWGLLGQWGERLGHPLGAAPGNGGKTKVREFWVGFCGFMVLFFFIGNVWGDFVA